MNTKDIQNKHQVLNPSSGIATAFSFQDASEMEIHEAATKAQAAFGDYSQSSSSDRARFLRDIANEIMDLGEELLECYCAESGLPKGRAQGERGRTVNQLIAFAEYLEQGSWRDTHHDEALPDRVPLPRPDLRKMNLPIGPIAVFGASNFPLAFSTAGGDTASALAAGCPVVVKAHPLHAQTSEMVAGAILSAILKNNLHPGVFSHLQGKSVNVGQQLVRHPFIKAVGFTGSQKAGRALYDLAAGRAEPIPVFAEMGSINPVIITPSALATKSDYWSEQLANSITLGAGQFCTKPGLLIGIDSEELDSFKKQLTEKLLSQEAQVMLSPDIHQAFEYGVQKMAEAKDVNNQKRTFTPSYEQSMGYPATASCAARTFIENPRLHQEVFGPFALLIACKNEEELHEVLQKLEGQLTGSILAEDEKHLELHKLISILQNKVGRIIYNGVPTGVEVCPGMTHGGPYPASTDSRFTSVGVHSIKRWLRPVSYQGFPEELLPEALRSVNIQ